jgi:hypothetical protein
VHPTPDCSTSSTHGCTPSATRTPTTGWRTPRRSSIGVIRIPPEIFGAFDEDDIVEFLLDWSPRRITMPADAASWFCASIGATQAVLARAAPTKIADELLAKSNVNRSTTHDARR